MNLGEGIRGGYIWLYLAIFRRKHCFGRDGEGEKTKKKLQRGQQARGWLGDGVQQARGSGRERQSQDNRRHGGGVVELLVVSVVVVAA